MRLICTILCFFTSYLVAHGAAEPLPEQAAAVEAIKKASKSWIEIKLDDDRNVVYLTFYPGGKMAPSSITDADLAHLKSLPHLESLNLTTCIKVTDAGLVHLAKLKKLTSLNLYGTKIKGAGLANLKGHPLKVLSLSRVKLDNDQLCHLSDFKSLEELSLEYTEIGDDGLQHCADLHNLRKLNLGRTYVTDAGMRYLKSLVKMEELVFPRGVSDRCLDSLLSMNQLTRMSIGEPIQFNGEQKKQLTMSGVLDLFERQGREWLVALKAFNVSHAVNENKKIFSLTFYDTPTTPLFTDRLVAYCNRIPNLQSLRFVGTSVTDAGLKQLNTDSQLTLLNLRGTVCTSQGMSHLAKMKKLETIELPAHAKNAAFAHLAELKNLRSLTAMCPQVDADGIEHLVGLAKLEHLRLDRSGAGNDATVHLAKIQSLRELHLNGSFVSGKGLEQLGRLTDLELLELNRTSVADGDLHHLANLKKLKTFQTLDSKVTPAARLEFFKETQGRTDTEIIALEGGRLTYDDDGHVTHVFFNGHKQEGQIIDDHLALIPGLMHLQEVRLYKQDISPDALQFISGMGNLKELNLYRCDNMNDDALEHVRELSSLEYLNMYGKGITDAGLKHLKGLKNLKYLGLNRTSITPAALAQLQSQLPNCRISTR